MSGHGAKDVEMADTLLGTGFALLRRSKSPAIAAAHMQSLATALATADLTSGTHTPETDAPTAGNSSACKPDGKAPRKELTPEQAAKKDLKDLKRAEALQRRAQARVDARSNTTSTSAAPVHTPPPPQPTAAPAATGDSELRHGDPPQATTPTPRYFPMNAHRHAIKQGPRMMPALIAKMAEHGPSCENGRKNPRIEEHTGEDSFNPNLTTPPRSVVCY